jgi:hypothetical protein
MQPSPAWHGLSVAVAGFSTKNLNTHQDPGEKKVYFEFGDYSASDVFFGHRHR